MPKLLYGVSSSFCAHFLKGQVAYMRSRGHEVVIISGPGEEISQLAATEGATLHTVDFSRSFSIFHDLGTLFRIIGILRREKPDLVNAGNPKSGFLIMLACWILHMPNRVFTLHGMVSDTHKGSRKRILRTTERISCSIAREVLVVSPSLLRHAVESGILREGKGMVIGNGSCNGVDVDRFSRSDTADAAASMLRSSLGLPEGRFVIGFVGRLSGDKGIDLLIAAFRKVREVHPRLVLLLVGPLDDRDPISTESSKQMAEDPDIYYSGKLLDVLPAYPLIDLLVLASFREGFGNVLIEAASMGIPVIAPDIPGCRDALVDGRNGMMFRKGDMNDLAAKIDRYVGDAALLEAHGKAGRQLVLERFRQEPLWDGIAALYDRLMA